MRLKYIISVIIGVGAFVLISCRNTTDMPPMSTTGTDIYSQVVNDTLPAPIIINLSDFEPPEVIKAAEPLYDSLSTPFGQGIPDITRYSTLDGLPQSITYNVLQGPDGMMWFLSVETLSRFDGSTFTTYNRFNGLMENSYSSEFILDSRNRIWIATDEGITVFDGRSFTSYTIDSEGNELGSIELLVKANDGSLWLSSQDNKLFHYQKDEITRIAFTDEFTTGAISNLLIDKKGHLIILTDNDEAFTYDGADINPYEIIPMVNNSESSLSLINDSLGNIWFHTGNDKIGRYDGSEITYYSMEEIGVDDQLTDIAEDGKGNLWISTTYGLSYFDGSTFINYSNADLGIEDNTISSIAFDEEGSLWAVIPQDGIIKINPTLSVIEIPDGVSIGNIFLDPTGNVWAQSDKGLGTYERDRLVWYFHEWLSDPNYSGNTFPAFDNKGQLWNPIFDEQNETIKLFKFDGSHYTIYGPEQGFNKEVFNGCFRIENVDRSTNTLEINCRNRILEFDGEKITQQNFLPDMTISSYLKDSKGNLWFGTDENGIYTYDGVQLSHYSTLTGLAGNNINRIREDQLGNIWATIDYGNIRITDTAVSSFNALDGLANLTAEINPDTVNNVLWFGTISGLVSLDVTQLNEEEPQFRRYNEISGFSIGPLRNPIPDAKGRVWGVSNGLFKFDYPILTDLPVAKPYIKNIQLNNQPVSWLSLALGQNKSDSMAVINEMGLKFGERLSGDSFMSHFNSFGDASFDSVQAPNFIPANLSLPYTNNTISFDFATISPSYGKSTRYQYRMEGYQDEWSPLSSETSATFGNLTEGSYVFELKALNANGVWSEVSYAFAVRPPWQRTWWAYLLYLLGAGSAVFGFISLRTRSLKRDRHRLEDEVSNRTSELKRSNLQLEKSFSELKSAQEQLVQQEKLASLGQLTAGIAHEIKNPLNFVNNFSDVSIELVEEAREEILAQKAVLRKGTDQNPLSRGEGDGEAGARGVSGGAKDVDQPQNSKTDSSPANTPLNPSANWRREAGSSPQMDLILEILDDIEANLRKIHEHGSRADGIVKSMLQHSRGGDGKPEPVNLNALVKEYVNLSFHGMRAGNDPINVDIDMQLDDSIGEIPLVAEDFSRVILNLCNNGFDAMREKEKLTGDGGPKTGERLNSNEQAPNSKRYSPKLTVRTISGNGKVTIEIEDNGPGIPDEIKDKILQPFFTTKKGTQGTGLGLSITNDIVKAHGGEIRVESQEGEGTEFIITLPFKINHIS